jgi:ribosomal protein L35AE/L33A
MDLSGDPLGVIVGYRIAYKKEALVSVPGVRNKRDAGKLMNRKAVWTDGKGNKYEGYVSGLHGRRGTLKVKFRKPLPLISLAKSINIGE